MKSIPLVRTRFPRLFAEALRAHGAPVEEYLTHGHIPPEALADEARTVSMHSVIRFLERALRDTEIHDIGLLACDIGIGDPGLIEANVYRARTLYRAIEGFRAGTRANFSRADVFLTRTADTAWLSRRSFRFPSPVAAQFELLIVAKMLHMLRTFIGHDWKPEQLRLQHADERHLGQDHRFRGIRIRAGSDITAIAFPIAALSNRTARSMPIMSIAQLDDLQEPHPLETLRELLNDCIEHETPRIETAAEICGLSTRTLGRHLSEYGVTYRRLVDDIRFSRALRLLCDENITITDVAFDVGYSDVAHFSRAFRRRAGISPREYRKQLGESVPIPAGRALDAHWQLSGQDASA